MIFVLIFAVRQKSSEVQRLKVVVIAHYISDMSKNLSDEVVFL